MLHVHRDVEFVSGSPSTLLEHVSGRQEPTPSSFLIGQSALECAERGRHAWPEGCRTNAAEVSETKCTKYRFLDVVYIVAEREYLGFTTKVPLLLLPKFNTLLTTQKSVNNLSPRLTFTTQS